MPKQQAGDYHKNSMKSIRGAINRYLQDIGRNIDIVRNPEFKAANRVLDGLLKDRMQKGISKPTAHKAIISPTDLMKIQTYLGNAAANPLILRHCVWYNISIHFVTRGIEFHNQLRLNSFEFLVDEIGEYASLTHETKQKNYQGGTRSDEAPYDKRMYATGTPNCPLAMLRLLITKTDPAATMLFNQYNAEAVTLPRSTAHWFTAKPLSKRTFSSFMPDISKWANTSRYTAHCLRATAIQYLNDAGHETRHIMFLSGHRNESSIRSYNRSVSSLQKKSLSSTLSAIAVGRAPTSQSTVPAVMSPQNQLSLPSSDVQRPAIMPTVSVSTNNNNFTATPGFLSNSSFTGCTFNFRNFK